MKKNFIGLALFASVLAGCQTAPKNAAFEDVKVDENTDFDAMFPGYGSDRRPASVAPIFEELFKALRGAKNVGAKSGGKTRDALLEFVNFANSWKGQGVDDLKALRDAKRAKGEGNFNLLNPDDLKGLNADVQRAIADAFLSKKRVADFPSLSAVRGQVDEQIKLLGKSDSGTASKGMKDQLLKQNDPKTYTNASEKMSINDKIAHNALLAERLNKAFSNMSDADPFFKTDEGRKLVVQAKYRADRHYRLTGDSHLLPDTCENLIGDKGEALRAYIKMYDEMYDSIKGLPADPKTGRLLCTNMAEITAWSIARFQQNTLGRSGLAAWTAVQEMTFCNYIKENTAQAARKLASVDGGKIGDMPKCQQ